MSDQQGDTAIALLHRAVEEPSLVFLDGFHAVKHALRFGGELMMIATADRVELESLARALAPDLPEQLMERAIDVDRQRVTPTAGGSSHWSSVWAAARRPVTPDVSVLNVEPRPLVLLENPRHAGNVGAVIRVAAAADIGGVMVLGGVDPWSTAAIRGASGLQFALPVISINSLDGFSRPVVALHPEGKPLGVAAIPARPIFAFGTERDGLSNALLDRATVKLRIPMREGVSSLNLATAVAVVVYGVSGSGEW